jgi:multiple sugar transport system permease protein
MVVIRRRLLKKTVLQLILLVVFIFWLMPVFWLVLSSFKLDVDSLTRVPKLIFSPTLDNYRNAFLNRGITGNFYNSLIVAVFSSILAIAIGTPAAYAISRFRFRKREDLFFWFLTTRMAPPVLAAIPFFVLSRRIGIYDTKLLLIIVNTLINVSWVVWMMRSFFDEISTEIDESCLVDGCTRMVALVRVILPLSKPGLVATSIFCLILSWNEYFFAMILTSVRSQTLPASISSFLTIHGLLWGQMSAVGTIVMLPILIFVFFTQRHLVRGLTMGAVKG